MLRNVSSKAPFAMAFAAGLTVSGCTGPGSGRSGESEYAQVADRMEQYADSVREEGQVPAIAIGIVTPDGLVESRFLGRNKNDDEVGPGTLFEIGSATKAFLGVTEAMLVDTGELSWDDRVVDHAPDFEMSDPWVTREFRIQDLIAQRSGLPEYAAETPSTFGRPWKDNVLGLKQVEPETSFRSTFAYQNIPHFVAGSIVADKGGYDSWNEAVTPMLLHPLGMMSSGTARDWLDTSSDTTRGFTVVDGKLSQLELDDFPSNAEGAGSIVSNLNDMSKWIQFHLNRGRVGDETLLAPERLDETYTPLVPVTDPYFLQLVGMGKTPGQVSYGTGWFIHSLPEGRVVEHGGNTVGYNAAVMFDPDRQVGVVVLSNQGFEGGSATPIGKYGMDIVQGREPEDYFAKTRKYLEETKRKEKGADPQSLEGEGKPTSEYVGVYHNDLLGTLDVQSDGERLSTHVGPEAEPARFERKTGDTFSLSWAPKNSGAARTEVTVVFDLEERPGSLLVEGFRFQREP